VGKKVGMVFPAADRDELDRFVLALTCAGKPSRYERTFPRKDGSPAVLDGTAVPIVVHERVTGLFLMSRDLTDRAQIQQGLALLLRRGRTLYEMAAGIDAVPDEQAASALAFGLKDIVEQDHRGVKRRLRPMLGLKNVGHAAITIAGVELLHRIRKGQFALGRLRMSRKTAPEIWNAVLAA
jgi:PAS domain-containing protein